MHHRNSLSPIATVRTRAEFEHALRTCGGVAADLYDFESGFEAAYHGQPQVVRGICQVCSGPSDFMVTMDWGDRLQMAFTVPTGANSFPAHPAV